MSDEERSYSISDFQRWEKETQNLCESGNQANQLIADVYCQYQEEELFDPASAAHQRFIAITAVRAHYWKQQGILEDKAYDWKDASEAALESAINATDRLGIFRELVWLRLSTIPIIESFTEDSWNEDVLSDLYTIANRAHSYLHNLQIDTSSYIYRISHKESSEGFLKRKNKKLYVNLYRLQRSALDKPRYVELVESWTWEPHERITLCVPLSIGCPNTCAMCDLGTYFGGNLSPEEIQRLIDLNFAQNVNVPINRDFENITFYFLAGGDALLHPEIAIIIEQTAKRFPGAQQVVSTIGMDIGDRMQALIETSSAIDRVGFQISICSLDDTLRQRILGSQNRILSVSDCLLAIDRFFRRSGRKGYISLLLIEDMYDDLDSIYEEVIRLVNPVTTHITLTMLQENSLPLSKRPVSLEQHEALKSRLEASGFQVSISTNDEDPENTVSCGVMEEELLLNNELFRKTNLIKLK